MKDIQKNFEHLYKRISSQDFLEMKSLGGEIPFYISPFNAKQQIEINDAITGLIKKLKNNGISVLNINLYDLSLEILNEELGNNEIFNIEKNMDKDDFKEALQSTLNVNEMLMPKIKDKIDFQEAKVYFLTGIGKVFPYIRSHNILNNLQNIAIKSPTVAFFPGEYTGQSLELFGLLKDDNYYRAFNINNIKLQL
jgi:hypothetical protein